ncbi:hypothetical protein PoB_006272300 [Plakobranchus ocellatus]|uniref:Arrestin-like N-terminal domain-containing protein n=1 Tax=Plakobranchus ocellatus TaxID=259542 RepID=A0AAV4CWI4_9GAST|nr:hypothetical protein PoB_006272300 [Plakobranchus ocellatus]
MIEKLDIDGKDLKLIVKLYWGQTASVRIEGEHSDFKSIKKTTVLAEYSLCPSHANPRYILPAMFVPEANSTTTKPSLGNVDPSRHSSRLV